MGGFREFLSIPLPNINKDDQLHEEIKILNQIPLFADKTVNDIPIDLGANKQVLISIFQNILTEKITLDRIKSLNIAKKLLCLSDAIISFNSIDITTLGTDKIVAFCDKIKDSDPEYLKLLQSILIIFTLRLPDSQLYTDAGNRIIYLFNSLDPNSIFTKALRCHTLVYHLRSQIERGNLVSNCVKGISNLLQEIYNSPFCGNIIPLLCQSLVDPLFLACREVFGRKLNNKIELLECSIYLPALLCTIAAFYPECLIGSKWQRLCEYFSRSPNLKREIFPSHIFYLQYPEQCTYTVASENVAALMFAFSYLYQLEIDGPNNDIYIACLRAIASKNQIGQHAVTRALYSMTKIEKYRSKLIALDNLITTNKNAAILYLNLFRENYTDIMIDLERLLNFGPRINSLFALTRENNIINTTRQLICIRSPAIRQELDIFSLTRSTDGLLKLPLYEVHKILQDDYLQTENFLPVVTDFIIKTLESGKTFKDVQLIPTFNHLCASYVCLLSRVQALEENKALQIHVPLILSIYDAIALSSEPTTAKIQEHTTLTSTNYIERMRIANAIKPIRNHFIKFAVLLCFHEYASLRYPLLLLLADTLDYTVDSSLHDLWAQTPHGFNIVMDKIVSWTTNMLQSENPYINNICFYVISKLVSHLPAVKATKVTNTIFEYINQQYNVMLKDPSEVRKFTRILNVVAKLSSYPPTKTAILFQRTTSRFMDMITNLLQFDKTKAYGQIPVLALNIICSLCNMNISLMPHADPLVRKVIDTIDEKFYGPIVSKIGELLNDCANQTSILILCALNTVLFLMESEFFIAEFMKQKITFKFSQLSTNPSFTDTLIHFAVKTIEIGNQISQYDTNYAKDFIHFSEDEELIRDYPGGAELCDKLEMVPKNLSMKIQLKDLQEFPDFRKTEELHQKLIDSQPKTMPINGSPLFLYFTKISDNTFLGEFVVRAQSSSSENTNRF